ncbi:MAG: ABC-type transport auxiliary lipoprotein family protein, partial [Thiohalobacteraceae bacterium]
RYRRCTTSLSLVVAMLWLSACTVLPKPEPIVVERYTLDPQPTVQLSEDVSDDRVGPVLLVPRPLVRAELDTPRMAYREQDYVLRYFARSRWADVPSQLLLPDLISAFEASGRYTAVVRTGSAAVPRLRLDTDLIEFSQDFRVEPSVFRVRLRVQLLDLETREVVLSHVFAAEQPASEDSPGGGAQAANAAWQRLLTDAVAYVNGRLPSD